MRPKKVLLSFAVATSLWAAGKGPVSDDTLNDQVKMKLAADTDVKGGALGIDVKDGVVTLSGKTET
ncbi:MAG: BON domain-containing protein, partial [Acidobacteriota bacterium]|nr:BON domain-containing protein [Acidobacteriota bacterium]